MARIGSPEELLDDLISLQREIDRLQKAASERETRILILKEKEGLFKKLFDRSRDGVAIIRDSLVEEINPSLARILGSSRHSVVGCRYSKFLAHGLIPAAEELYSRRSAGEKVASVFESTLVDSRGQQVPIEISAGLTSYRGEKADLVIIRNLTYIKKAEAEIVRLKPYRESLLENVNIWLEVYDDKRNVVIWNKAAEEISGYASEEILGTHKNLGFLYPDGTARREITGRLFHAADMRKQSADSFETEIVCRDGKKKILSWHARNIYRENKKVIGRIVLGLDISARVEAESALRNSHKIIDALLNAITESIFMTDPKGTVVAANSIAAQRWGKEKLDLLGKNIFEVLPEDLAETYRVHFHKAIKSRQPFHFESTYAGRYYDTTIYPITNGNGVQCLAGFALDVTDRKKAEAALLQQNTLLEEKNVALREMIRQIGVEKHLIEKQIQTNVDRLLLPLIDKLKAKGGEVDKVYIKLLEGSLKEISSSFGRELSAAALKLTPREIEIANMIMNGLTSKQIARLLNVSSRTIEIHRGKIRKKVGLKNRGQNLQAVLRMLESTPAPKYL